MDTHSLPSPRPGESMAPGTIIHQDRLFVLPLIAILLVLLVPHATALSGTDTVIWSPNITLNEKSDAYYEFSNFFVLEGDRVVWMNVWSERKSDDPLHADTIYLMNITTNETRAIARAPGAGHPWTLFPPFSLSRDIVAYTELGTSDIYLFNITDGKEYRLTQDGALESLDELRGNSDPSMDGDRIVWSKKKSYNKGHDADIVIQNLTTGKLMEICTAKGDQVDPQISSTKVVWRDMRDESGSRGGDIYLYDLATSTETPVCTAQDLQQQADVSDDNVVWSDFRDGSPAIYLYNLTTKSETRISEQSTKAYRPYIDGHIVAWSEYSSIDTRDDPIRWIVLYDLNTGTRERINASVSSYGLDDIDGGKILYSTGSGDTSREKGYLHLYVIDTPRIEATPGINSGSSLPGAQVSNTTGGQPGTQSPAGSLPPTRPATGFTLWVAGLAMTICAAGFRGRKNGR